MAKLYDLARMTTATTGTGTITLGSAVYGYLTFASAGIVDGDIISYAINDGANSEIGTGTYTASGTTLTRGVTKSTNSNAAINLSGTAQVFITPRAEELPVLDLANTFTQPQTITSAAASTSTTTGALKVTGGIGAQGQMYASEYSAVADSSVSAHFDVNSSPIITLTAASEAIITPASGTGSWIVSIAEFFGVGTTAIYICSFGRTTVLVANDGVGTVWSAAAADTPTAARISVYWNSTSGAFKLANNLAGTMKFKVCLQALNS